MKWIVIILILLSCSISYGQQIIELCPGEETKFEYHSGSNLDGVYTWTINGQTLVGDTVSFTWTDPGEYDIKLNFMAINGCEVSDTYQIIVINCQETHIYFPNSFTPNSDNINDAFGPVGVNYYDLELTIYNRWGQIVYNKFVSNEGRWSNINDHEMVMWDGSYLGYICQDGIYVYMAKWKNSHKRNEQAVGHISIIR